MKVALALGGGAALGWAHIGVIRALEAAGITIGAIAGTSMGALIGAARAAGTLDAVERVARDTRRRHVLRHLVPSFRRGALLAGRSVEREILSRIGPAARLEALEVPFTAVAADLMTGDEVWLTRGPLLRALQASMALPALFRPVEIEGRRLIDGGMVANLPLAAARALAPDLPLVAVDLFADYAAAAERMMPGGRLRALPTARAAFLMLMQAQGRQAVRIDPPAMTIAPAVSDLTTGSFHCADALIAAGERSVHAALPQLRSA